MKIQNREEFIIKAIRVFNKKGIQGASVASITKEMNTVKGTLYYYFSSKEDLLDQCIEYVKNRALSGLNEDIDLSGSFRDYISQIVKNSINLPNTFPEGLVFLDLYMHNDFYDKTSFNRFPLGIIENEKIQNAPDYKCRKEIPSALINFIVGNILTITNRFYLLFPEQFHDSTEILEKSISEMIWQIITTETE